MPFASAVKADAASAIRCCVAHGFAVRMALRDRPAVRRTFTTYCGRLREREHELAVLAVRERSTEVAHRVDHLGYPGCRSCPARNWDGEQQAVL